MTAARLSLGPLLFNWSAEKRRDFYFRIADEAAVESVFLGEVVCAKRTPFFAPYLPEVVERLRGAGKEIVFSTLTLPLDEADRQAIRDLASCDYLVEANDLAAVRHFAGSPFAVGPLVNVYNEDTLAYLARLGAVRVCLPPELPGSAIAALAATGVAAIEVQVFGRQPLAISARCYHARAQGLHRDGCRYVCDRDADGMAVRTLEGEPFLAVNGLQTLSHSYANLLGELEPLRTAGVGYFRLQPHDLDMVAVARCFRDVLDRRLEAAAGQARLADLAGEIAFSNGFYYGREGAVWVPAGASA